MQAVAALEPQWRHGAGQNDGNLEIREGLLEVEARLDHGVGAVRDHDRRAFRKKPGHAIPDFSAILIRHFQAVFVHQVESVNLGVRQAEHAQIAVQLGRAVLHHAALLGVDLLDGSAGRD